MLSRKINQKAVEIGFNCR